jgi:uncharacterized protein (TIGR02594 family)
MRVLLFFLLLSGCSAGVVSQSIEESVSGAVYRAVEPAVPDIKQVVLRPPPRPVGLVKTVVAKVVEEPVTPVALRTDEFLNRNPILVAENYLGFSEKSNRSELREFMGVDPRVTEWCAAFANSVLRDAGVEGSASVSDYPLMARSFLEWGDPVDHRQEDPQPGDIVVFPRGRQSWQGHVGFFVDTVEVDGKQYWQILGGNQSNAVTVDLYVPERALAVRRAPQRETRVASFFDRLRLLFRSV